MGGEWEKAKRNGGRPLRPSVTVSADELPSLLLPHRSKSASTSAATVSWPVSAVSFGCRRSSSGLGSGRSVLPADLHWDAGHVR